MKSRNGLLAANQQIEQDHNEAAIRENSMESMMKGGGEGGMMS